MNEILQWIAIIIIGAVSIYNSNTILFDDKSILKLIELVKKLADQVLIIAKNNEKRQ